jgi:hypothetical protein
MRAAKNPVRLAHARIVDRISDRRSAPEPGGLHRKPSARQGGSVVSLNPRVRSPNGFSTFRQRVSEAKKGLQPANLAEAGARLWRPGPACLTNPPEVWRVRSSGPAGASDGGSPPPVSRGKPFFASPIMGQGREASYARDIQGRGNFSCSYVDGGALLMGDGQETRRPHRDGLWPGTGHARKRGQSQRRLPAAAF